MNITIEQFIQAVKDSTITIEHLVNSSCYYAERGDTNTERTEVVSPSQLIYELGQLANENN